MFFYMEEQYFTKQILTYMGNKRKFLTKIDEIITFVKTELQQKNIDIAEGFSGSGIVSRLLKNRVMSDYDESLKTLYVNDMAGYSKTLNECYLTSTQDLTPDDIESLIHHKKVIDVYIDNEYPYDSFISQHWAPKNSEDIQENERVYYTHENAVIIDKMRKYIEEKVEPHLKCFLLAPLIVQCSIHNNTNGQFSAYFKNKEKTRGMFGGKTKTDLKRITKKIEPVMPVLTSHKADVKISQQDTNTWIKTIPEVDLVYYDPPYNKHPYNIYYFLLDIINNWDTNIEIPDTYRGQPKNWIKSGYCSLKKAKSTFHDLIKNTKAKFILISYNNKGIISVDDMLKILEQYSNKVYTIPVDHKDYNKFIGIAAKKRKTQKNKIEEFLWLMDCRKDL